MNGHKCNFRLYAAGMINKMDNKPKYDYLICYDIDCFHEWIADMIHVGNNTESQLEELICRKERKWVWNYGFISPYGLSQDFNVKTKGVEIDKSVTGHYDYLISYFLFYYFCFHYLDIICSMG